MSTCRSCGAEVLWVEMPSGKRTPLDSVPVSTGNVGLIVPGKARPLAKGEVWPGQRYESHFSTCPQAHSWRRESPREPGKRWSASSLMTLGACGYKWYLKYVEKRFRPFGVSAFRGRRVHEVAAEGHKRQMAARDAWPPPDEPDRPASEMINIPGTPEAVAEARDLAATKFDAKWSSEEVALTADERAIGEANVRGAAKDFSVDMAGFHVRRVAPPISPVAVERKVVVKPKDSDIEIVSVVDLIDRIGDEEAVRDLKTSEKAPFPKSAERSSQLTMYALTRAAEVGKIPTKLVLDHVWRTPVKHEENYIAQETTRDTEDLRIQVDRINLAVESVAKGVFLPADPGAIGSPCGYCEYAPWGAGDGSCKYVRSRA